jgi:phosphomannomutase
MVQMINLLSIKNQPLSELIRPLLKYASTGEINIRVSHTRAIMSSLETAYSDATIDHLDGLTVNFPEWWFNLRSSNTEPLIRLNLEADSREAMNRRLTEVMEIIRQTDPNMEIETG